MLDLSTYLLLKFVTCNILSVKMTFSNVLQKRACAFFFFFFPVTTKGNNTIPDFSLLLVI